ncbi:hypothetical protein Syun_018742 [Stephania yunnanensis]|uniref:Uncharacterized protein n=1 Tax=Stephania yunnanensis TaxID=152371 RepID=A0AAP0ITX7_9MAGN
METEKEMQKFTAKIVDMMKQVKLYASQGGPTILSQASRYARLQFQSMNQQEEGWPLGLQPLNMRVGLVRTRDFSGSISFNNLITGSPSSSTDTSSDLDTEQQRRMRRLDLYILPPAEKRKPESSRDLQVPRLTLHDTSSILLFYLFFIHVLQALFNLCKINKSRQEQAAKFKDFATILLLYMFSQSRPGLQFFRETSSAILRKKWRECCEDRNDKTAFRAANLCGAMPRTYRLTVLMLKTEYFRLYSVSNQKRNRFSVSDRISDDDFRDGIDSVSVPFLIEIRDEIFANQRRKFPFLICYFFVVRDGGNKEEVFSYTRTISVFNRGCKWRVGDGNRIQIFHDLWLPDRLNLRVKTRPTPVIADQKANARY